MHRNLMHSNGMQSVSERGSSFLLWAATLAVIPWLVSCATTGGSSSSQPQVAPSRSNDAVSQILKNTQEPAPKDIVLPEKEVASRKAVDIENLTIDEVIRMEEPNTQNLYDNSRYDFPITMNSRVEGWIDYFTGKGRHHMERYLGRSSRYIPLMKQVFKKAGMPEDLVYLALIESGFNLHAKSRARAVGPWQFMKATGKRYGLKVDAWVDERRDPIESTVAAANYLKDLYLMFESWYLAASAYNAGEYKILRAIEELKTNNYWRICETRMLRRETKDYIPKLIAAAIIGKNPAKYGFEDVSYLEPLEYETVNLDYPVHLREIAKIVDVSLDDLRDLNPQLIRQIVPPNQLPYAVRVPVGTQVLVDRAAASLKTTLANFDLPKEHVVKPGESLQSISQRYRIRARDLANANNLSTKERLTPGAALVIPRKGEEVSSVAKPAKARRNVSSTPVLSQGKPGAGDFKIHTVKRGESLWSISEQYNVTVQEIFRWNQLKKSQIHPGTKLKIRS